MPNLFGVSLPYPPQPGSMGMQVGQSLAPPTAPEPSATPPTLAGPAPLYRGDAEDQMRDLGARAQGGPGQQTEGDAALMHAIGEHLTRMAGGGGPTRNPMKDRTPHVQRLVELGLTPDEARLMVESGGI